MHNLEKFRLRSLLLGSLLLSIATCPTVVLGQALQNGEEILSSIETGELASFDFNVASVGQVIVSVGETGTGFPAEPVLQVFDPDGVSIAINGGNSEALIQFTAAETGTFTAVVSEGQNNEPLEFRIRALAIASAEPLLINERDSAISNGQEVLSSIPLGTFAVFPIQVDAAGTVRVSVGETGAGFPAEPVIQVFDPDGVSIASNNGNSDASVQFTTLQIGTYTAVVSEGQNDEPLEFRIRALAVSSAEPLLINERDSEFSNGQELVSSFPLGTFAVFPIQVDAAGTVFINVGETGSGFPAEPVLQVFDPDGESIASNNGNSDAFVQFTTLQTGTYLAVVSEGQNDEALEFRMRALTVPSAGPLLINGRDCGISQGQGVVSSFPLGTFAVFPFQVDAAGTVTLNVGETGTGFPAEPTLLVFDPDGQSIASDSGNSEASIQFSTLTIGKYTAVVRDGQNDEAMQFSIVATGISEDLPSLTGDVNRDGKVDFQDISPFILVLSTGDFLAAADINQDGIVDFLDISPFISLLSS